MKKGIFVALVWVFVFVFSSGFLLVYTEMRVGKYNGFTVMLDAGHGARDGGSVGVGGTVEKDINLIYVKNIKAELEELGFKVVLTRENDMPLYSPFATNKKISDMNARMEKIKKVNPSLVVSVHMNSFPDSSVSGVNTFYKLDDENSKKCADVIQQSLNTYCGAKNTISKQGDYYILNSSYYTSVLIECGFLSNSEEEKKLNSKEYQQKFAKAVASGIMLFFGNGENF